MKKLFSFAHIWILALPLLFNFSGSLSNQLVLAANHDKFPVMLNPRKLKEFQDADAGPPTVIQDLGNIIGIPITAPKPAVDDMIDDVHCVMTKDTHLNFLADWIDLKEATYSPGDMLLYLSEYLNFFAFPMWFALVLNDYWKGKHVH